MTGAERIAAERQRQIDVEGWTPQHDDQHRCGELIAAAGQYAEAAHFIASTGRTDGEFYFHHHSPDPSFWPWDRSHWKPDWSNAIRNLEKAGALIAAEIDRLQRLEDNRATPNP